MALAARRSETAGEHAPEGAGHLRLLLVATPPDESRRLREVLAGAPDFVLETAPSVALASIRLAEGGTDAVLFSLGLSGPERLVPLASLARVAGTVPVLALAGADADELASAAVRAGAQDCLVAEALTPALLRRSVRHARERKRNEARRQHLTEVLRALHNVGQLLVREHDRDRLLRRTCELLAEARGYHAVWIVHLAADGRVMGTAAAGIEPVFADLLSQADGGGLPGCCRRALASETPVALMPPIADCSGCRLATEHQASAALAVALRHGERTYGVLVVSLPAETASDAQEASLCREAAADLAYALRGIDLAEAHRAAESEIASLARFPAEDPNPVLRLDRQGLILFANAAGAILLRAWGVATGAAAPDFWRTQVTEALEVGQPRTVETEADGRTFAIVVAPVCGGGYVNLYATDIGERRQVQQKLEHERVLLRTLIDALPDHIYAKDRESRFVVANVAVARATGCQSVEEVTGRTDADFYPPPVAARFRAEEVEVIQSGRAMIDHEDVIEDRQGRRHWFSSTKVPLRDGTGAIVGLVGIGRDIGERKRAEAALRAGEENLRQLMLHARCALWCGEVRALHGHQRATEMPQGYDWCIRVEPDERAAQSLLPLEVPPGRTYANWLNEHLSAEARALKHAAGLAALQRGDSHYAQEYPCVDRNGQMHWLHEEVTLWPDAPGHWQVFGVWVDVTERKHAEEALRQQTAELRARNQELVRFNRASAGRELRMIELKQQVNDLSRQLGQPPPYADDLRATAPAGDGAPADSHADQT